MTDFDWAGLLRDHPVFEPLDESDRVALLQRSTSEERRCSAGDIVLRQGTIGNSVLIVGKGRATVMLERKDEDPVTLYTVSRGELLGEMALFEDRPRAATVEATEDMVLLEIKGEPFLDLLKARSEIALILLARLSRRLRYTDQKLLERRFSGLDETVTVLNARIDSTLKTTDASLAASKTMFDQTNARAQDIIASAERARSQFKWVGGIVTSAIAIAGTYGLWDLKNIRSDIEGERTAVIEIKQDVQDELRQMQTDMKNEIALMQASMKDEGQRFLLDTKQSMEAGLTEVIEIRAKIDAAQAQFATDQEELRTAQEELRTLTYDIEATRLEAEESAREIASIALKAKAQSEISTLIDDLKSAKFTNETFVNISSAAESFDPDVLSRLSELLTRFLRDGMPIHNALKKIDDVKPIENPNGLVFVQYYRALSAAITGDDAFDEVKNGLQWTIAFNKEALAAPPYFNDKDREIIQYLARRHIGILAKRDATVDADVRQQEAERRINDVFSMMSHI